MKPYVQRVRHIAAGIFRFIRRHKILSGVLIIVLLIAVGVSVRNTFKPPDYKTAVVSASDVVEIVSESGTLVTNGRADVYSPTTGVIDAVYVTNGDSVHEGQELFTTKSTATAEEQAAAYAEYLAAKSALETAQATAHSLQADMFANWDEYKELAESDSYEHDDGTPKNHERELPEFQISQKSWYAAEAQYKKQQTVIAQAQAQTSAAWLGYQATQNAVVTAPIAGTVSNLAVIPGSGVRINAPAAPATPVLTVGNFTRNEALIQLGEDDIFKVQPEQEVSVTVDAIDNVTLRGIVRRVDTIGTEIGGVIRYGVYIELLDQHQDLRPGMSIDATITTARREGVMTVPNAAVKPYKGGRAVRVPGSKKGDVEYVPVTIGMRGESNTEIVSGVEMGQTVITTLPGEDAKKKGPLGF